MSPPFSGLKETSEMQIVTYRNTWSYTQENSTQGHYYENIKFCFIIALKYLNGIDYFIPCPTQPSGSSST
jgi:hypothetical protein